MRKALLVAVAATTIAGLGVYVAQKPMQAPVGVSAHAEVLPHVISFEGASNFRDIGGYETADGQHVRTGLVYRSGSTDTFTAADISKIRKLGIRRFCDLRDAPERHPDRPQGVDFPLIETWPDTAKSGVFDISSPEAANKTMLTNYSALPDTYAQQIGDIFRHIARGDLPLAYNCSAGKDRTGVTTAILLRVLGVPMDAVMQDYLASNRYFDPAKLTDGKPVKWADEAPEISPQVLAVLGRVEPEWLEASFAGIDARYGSLDAYLHKGLGLSDAEVASIRQRLLEGAARH